ncbi:hypothetical protein D9M72_578020 [compost metagenome]
MADDLLVVLEPVEGVEIQHHVSGEVRISRPEGRAGQPRVGGHDVELLACRCVAPETGARIQRRRGVQHDFYPVFGDVAGLLSGRRQLGPEVHFGDGEDGGDAFGLPYQECEVRVDDGVPARQGTDPFRGGLVAQIRECAEDDV